MVYLPYVDIHSSIDRWRQLGVPKRSAGKKATTTGSILCAAVTRGYLARRRVAMIRRERAKAAAQRAELKRSLLQRRLVKVSAASQIVASCLIANASVRRRERRRLVRAAVAMVGRGRVRNAYIWEKLRLDIFFRSFVFEEWVRVRVEKARARPSDTHLVKT